RCRVRDAPRPLRARPTVLLGPPRADRLRNRGHLRANPERRADLLDRAPRDLRRLHDVRLPASTPDAGHSCRTAPRGLDLPRRSQRLPALALALQPRLVSDPPSTRIRARKKNA